MGKKGKKKTPGNGHVGRDSRSHQAQKAGDAQVRAQLRNERNKQKYGKRYTDKEIRGFAEVLARKGLTLHEAEPDGNCFFRSVSKSLNGNQSNHQNIRQECVDYIEHNPDVFKPFIEDDDESFEQYISRMRCGGEWGGQPELMAISWSRQLNVMVHQADMPAYLVECGQPEAPVIHISYHDGNHYNAITPDETAIKRASTILRNAPTAYGEPDGENPKKSKSLSNSRSKTKSKEKNDSGCSDKAIVAAATGVEDMSRIGSVLDNMAGDVHAAIAFLHAELESLHLEEANVAALHGAIYASIEQQTDVEALRPKLDFVADQTMAAALQMDKSAESRVAREESAMVESSGHNGSPKKATARLSAREKKKVARELKREKRKQKGAPDGAADKAVRDGGEDDQDWNVLRM